MGKKNSSKKKGNNKKPSTNAKKPVANVNNKSDDILLYGKQFSGPKVTILTVSQVKRIPFLHNLSKMIQKQDNENVYEWVIVNGSNNDEDYDKFNEEITKVSCGNIPIKIAASKNLAYRFIGAFRNLGNKHVSGDIIVCMDDDDFYFPNYVSSCVNELENDSTVQLVGCSSMLMYDYGLDSVFRIKSFGQNHTVNCCMAYRKEYIKYNTYDETRPTGEEKSFLNEYRSKMAQLPALSALIHMSYADNTFSGKRENMLNNMVGNVRDPQKVPQIYTAVNSTLKSLMKNDEIYNGYMDTFSKINIQKETDVVFYYGNIEDSWDPRSNDLNVYRRRCLDLGREFVKHGLTVSVYGKFDFNELEIDEITFYNLRFFNVRNIKKNLILVDFTGFVPLCQTKKVFEKLNAEKIFVDCQHNSFNFYPYINEYNKDKIIFVQKSQYQHLMNPPGVQPCRFDYKKAIVPNGVNLELFRKDYGITREPRRFCYTSNYANGLEVALEHTWPKIIKAHPDAELHIYYGHTSKDEKFNDRLKKLFMQDGVYEHGRVSHEEIAKELQRSSFLLYYTGTPNETDGMSIMEAMASGCIPVIWDKNIYSSFNGLVCKTSPMELLGHNELGDKLCSILTEDSERPKVSESLKKSNLILSNQFVAEVYINAFRGNYIPVQLQAKPQAPPAPPKDFDLPSNIDLSKYVDSDSDSEEYESDSDDEPEKEELTEEQKKQAEEQRRRIEEEQKRIQEEFEKKKAEEEARQKEEEEKRKILSSFEQKCIMLNQMLGDNNSVVKSFETLQSEQYKEYVQIFASGQIEVSGDNNIDTFLAGYYNEVRDKLGYSVLTDEELAVSVNKLFGNKEESNLELPSNIDLSKYINSDSKKD